MLYSQYSSKAHCVYQVHKPNQGSIHSNRQARKMVTKDKQRKQENKHIEPSTQDKRANNLNQGSLGTQPGD